MALFQKYLNLCSFSSLNSIINENRTKAIKKHSNNQSDEAVSLIILYNNNLKSNLKMLDYLTKLEERLLKNLNKTHQLEVTRMKKQLQANTVELTNKINSLS